jgi:uncharacterized RDD family membrane protein YckC
LLAIAEEAPAPLELPPAQEDTWDSTAIDRFRHLPEPEGPAMTLAGPAYPGGPVTLAAADTPALPLFAPDTVDDDPLVKLPASPRPPLAVRRTPDTPRLRTTSSFNRVAHEDAVLQFIEEDDDVAPQDDTDDDFEPAASAPVFDEPIARFRRPEFRAEAVSDVSPFGKRFTAAVIDHGILLGIDLVVLYVTLRLTDLTFADWRVLPWLPLAAFLMSLKVAYLCAFTTAGGQTIGKMATHIRVVSEDGGALAPGRALRRAVLGLVSIATAGAPFLTAVADPLRRGIHDRASGSRVVALSSR